MIHLLRRKKSRKKKRGRSVMEMKNQLVAVSFASGTSEKVTDAFPSSLSIMI